MSAPPKLLRLLRPAAHRVAHLIGTRRCPLCEWRGVRFWAYGKSIMHRDEAMCPRCRSLERHRLAYLLLRPMLAGTDYRVLHVAPEVQIEKWLRSLARDYLSIDLAARAMRVMDLTSLDLDDKSRDLIWCSHVLEHIPDDRAAMDEMHRVLADGGLAVIQVPVLGDKTFEDPSAVTPAQRLKAFHQEDHCRVYGPDIEDRLTASGFRVQIVDCEQRFSPRDQKRQGLNHFSSRLTYLCRKAADPSPDSA